MITDQKMFDLSFLEQMEDIHFMTEVITLYIKDTNNDLNVMKSALDSGALDTVFKTAHKMKSSTGMLQANSLSQILDQTEQVAKAGERGSRLSELVARARMEFDQLRPALQMHLQRLQRAA
jgi:HPt (histidine-containing phosphotransfer) domain-containing protein